MRNLFVFITLLSAVAKDDIFFDHRRAVVVVVWVWCALPNWGWNFKRDSFTKFLTLVVLIKQLVVVPLDISRKDSDFLSIFEELFVFLIDYPVYSSFASRDSLVYSSSGSSPKFVYKKKLDGAKYNGESRHPCDWNTGESWLLGLFITRTFFVNLFWYLKFTPCGRFGH